MELPSPNTSKEVLLASGHSSTLVRVSEDQTTGALVPHCALGGVDGVAGKLEPARVAERIRAVRAAIG